MPERTGCTSGPLHLNLKEDVDSGWALTEGQRCVVLRLLSNESFAAAWDRRGCEMTEARGHEKDLIATFGCRPFGLHLLLL